MRDWWDQDPRHPANERLAEYFSKTFIEKIEDKEGVERTILITAYYRVDELGVRLDWYSYEPRIEELRESVEEVISQRF